MASSRAPSILRQFLLLSLAGFLPFQVFAQNSTMPSHGLWVWKTSTVLTAPGSAEALRKFCRSHEISEVYISFSAPGGAQGRVAEDALLANSIRELHKSSIRVEALLSER